MQRFLLAFLLFFQTFTTFSMEKKEIYLAGGCYWGLEYLLQDLDGIIETTVGFSGGTLNNATYDDVKTGETGHAETIQVIYNAEIITTEKLLFEFFRMHNPTTINQQGNDRGTQYRSAIFYVTEDQKQAIHNVISQVNASGHWQDPVVTEIHPFKSFHPAQESHQNYLKKNPNGYSCHFVRDFKFTD